MSMMLWPRLNRPKMNTNRTHTHLHGTNLSSYHNPVTILILFYYKEMEA